MGKVAPALSLGLLVGVGLGAEGVPAPPIAEVYRAIVSQDARSFAVLWGFVQSRGPGLTRARVAKGTETLRRACQDRAGRLREPTCVDALGWSVADLAILDRAARGSIGPDAPEARRLASLVYFHESMAGRVEPRDRELLSRCRAERDTKECAGQLRVTAREAFLLRLLREYALFESVGRHSEAGRAKETLSRALGASSGRLPVKGGGG